eukprot:671851-Amphidinium_carterae.1
MGVVDCITQLGCGDPAVWMKVAEVGRGPQVAPQSPRPPWSSYTMGVEMEVGSELAQTWGF